MEYSKEQLDLIQSQLIKTGENLDSSKGLSCVLAGSIFATWRSHANLAGYLVESGTDRMYKQENNVKVYYNETN